MFSQSHQITGTVHATVMLFSFLEKCGTFLGRCVTSAASQGECSVTPTSKVQINYNTLKRTSNDSKSTAFIRSLTKLCHTFIHIPPHETALTHAFKKPLVPQGSSSYSWSHTTALLKITCKQKQHNFMYSTNCKNLWPLLQQNIFHAFHLIYVRSRQISK